MSKFCKNCFYNPNKTLEENVCPFNSLYWDFVARNQKKLGQNKRLFYTYNTWNKFDISKQQSIQLKARQIISDMRQKNL